MAISYQNKHEMLQKLETSYRPITLDTIVWVWGGGGVLFTTTVTNIETKLWIKRYE